MPAAARPSLTPRWKLANRSRVAEADRAGAGADGSAAAVPGTRLALGTRLGSPAVVTPLDDGSAAAAAACQPSSAGDVHAAWLTWVRRDGAGWTQPGCPVHVQVRLQDAAGDPVVIIHRRQPVAPRCAAAAARAKVNVLRPLAGISAGCSWLCRGDMPKI